MDIDFTLKPGEGLPVAQYARLRDQGRLVWSEGLAGWLVWAYEDVRAVLSDPLAFTSEGTPISKIFGGEAMLVIDTPLHNRMRAIWAQHVSVGALEARALEIQNILLRLLEPVKVRVNAGESVEMIDVFHAFMAEVIIAMMGMPRTYVSTLMRWNRLLLDIPTFALEPGTPEYVSHIATKDEVYAFLQDQMRDRRARLAAGERLDDLVALMVAAEGQDGMTPARAADNLLNFFLGAIDTTTKWLGNIVVRLARDPDLQATLRADPKLIVTANEEIMRVETAAQMILRLVRNDGTEFAGHRLKAGERIYLMLGAANRDQSVFPDAEVFNPRRVSNPHVSFGLGLHHCLGRNVARIECRIVTEALLGLLPELEVESDYGNTWMQWGPVSLRLRRAHRAA